jgi:hypothetical protein
MKRALYYAIRTGSLYCPVIAVTSEKGRTPGLPDRWHGREVRGDMPTHGKMSDLRGKFEHVEQAYAMQGRIRELADSYDAARKVLSTESSRLYAREREAVEALLRGDDPALATRPKITYEGDAL